MRPTAENCFHLPVEVVLEIHSAAILQFGGSPGVRDRALLESAVAAPQASWGGRSAYSDVEEIAAAYLFFLCRNHPFVDGNKRAALGACLVFLRLNGRTPQRDGPEWEELVLAVAAGEFDREQTARGLRMLVRDPR